jgi:hypothetical protein
MNENQLIVTILEGRGEGATLHNVERGRKVAFTASTKLEKVGAEVGDATFSLTAKASTFRNGGIGENSKIVAVNDCGPKDKFTTSMRMNW